MSVTPDHRPEQFAATTEAAPSTERAHAKSARFPSNLAWRGRHVEFTDGVTRAVFDDPDGQQFVIGDDSSMIRGVWFIQREEFDVPVIVDAAAKRAD